MKNVPDTPQFFRKIWNTIEKKQFSCEDIDFYHICNDVGFALNFVDQEGYITWANREAIASGMIPEDFIGRNLRDLKKHKIILEPAALKVLKTRKKHIGEVTQYSGRTFMSVTAPVTDAGNGLEGVVALTIDIADVYDFVIRSATRALRATGKGAEMAGSSSATELGSLIDSDSMAQVMKLAGKIAPSTCPVLILGESGTGKEVMAKHIHALSPRAGKRLLAINCGAIPGNLMESELFGYEKGAFTGAWRSKKGLLEEAAGGTLLLDEIGDLDIQLQVKLLRVLQEGTFRRVGGTDDLKADVRILAATNKNLEELIAAGKFRADLFYRLNVFTLNVPPLRQRKDDLKKLIPFFLEKFNKQYGLSRYLSREAWTLLLDYAWPGNVRELANVIERLAVLSDKDVIQADDVEKYLQSTLALGVVQAAGENREAAFSLSLPDAVARLEKEMLINAKKTCHTCREMAKALGIEFSTVARKMKKYGLS